MVLAASSFLLNDV